MYLHRGSGRKYKKVGKGLEGVWRTSGMCSVSWGGGQNEMLRGTPIVSSRNLGMIPCEDSCRCERSLSRMWLCRTDGTRAILRPHDQQRQRRRGRSWGRRSLGEWSDRSGVQGKRSRQQGESILVKVFYRTMHGEAEDWKRAHWELETYP